MRFTERQFRRDFAKNLRKGRVVGENGHYKLTEKGRRYVLGGQQVLGINSSNIDDENVSHWIDPEPDETENMVPEFKMSSFDEEVSNHMEHERLTIFEGHLRITPKGKDYIAQGNAILGIDSYVLANSIPGEKFSMMVVPDGKCDQKVLKGIV